MKKWFNELIISYHLHRMYCTSFEQYISDMFTVHVECPFMELLGFNYHLELKDKNVKSGWYKDNKFMTERM